MKFHLKSKKDVLFYKTGIVGKVICLIYFLFFTWQITIHLFEGMKINNMIIPICLEVLAILGLLYKEEWMFDKNNGIIRNYFGVRPFVSIKEIKVSDISRIEITHFIKGSFVNDESLKKKNRVYRSQVAFSLITKNEEKIDIEIIDEKKSGGFCEAAALKLSTYLDVPFYQDRSRDMDIDVSLKDLK